MSKRSIRSLLRGDIGALGLTPAQALVLMYLIDRAGADGTSFPSQVRMARELGLSRQGVQKSIDHLVSLEIVTVTAKVKGRANGYRVQGPANSVGTPPANSTGQVRVQGPANSVGTKYLDVPDRSLPPLPKALRAADDGSEFQSIENGARRRSGAESTSRAGNEAAQAEPLLEARKPSRGRVPAQPQTARDAIAWPTAVPGQPGVWKETA